MLTRIKNFIGSIISDSNDRNIFAIGSSHFGLASKNYKDIKNINQVEYKVFSQNGEDGIIDFLLNQLNIQNPKFLEIGVGNYKESNTRYIFMKNPTKGMIIDNVKNLKQEVSKNVKLWKGDLKIIEETVTSDNIFNILKINNFQNNLDLFSLDIDGIDYWVMKELPDNLSKIVITEYNATFGANLEVTVPNINNFNRTKYHYSNLCYGMSLRAIINLMSSKNYTFVGANKACNNAFFINKSEVNKLNIDLPDTNNLEKYTQSNILESRSNSGSLTFLSDNKKLEEISECEIINLSDGLEKRCLIKDLFRV